MQITAATLLGMASMVAAHGYISDPPQRMPGPNMQAACGDTIYNNQASDHAGPVQLLMQSASSIVDADACNLWLCKGYQLEDDATVETYSLGQTIPFEVTIVAPHTGYANVSIVDTVTNSVKGDALISWDVYASTSTGVTADETSFDVTLPETLDGCTTAGECVIQWYWYAPPGVDQTYEGCIDFTIGEGSASPSSAASSAASSTAAATSAAATSAAATSVAASSSAIVPESSSAAVSSVVASLSVPTSAAATSSAAATTLVTSTKQATSTAAASSVISSFPSSAYSAPSSTGTSSSGSGTVKKYYQCGGLNYTGATECESGSTCTVQNDYYHQCV